MSGMHSSIRLKKDKDCRITKLQILQREALLEERDYQRAKPECNLEGNWLILHKIMFSFPIFVSCLHIASLPPFKIAVLYLTTDGA